MSYLTQFDISAVIVPVQTITGDAGPAVVPVAGNVNILGGNVLTTTGAGATLTIDLDNGANGQLLIGGGADPLWADLQSSGSTIAITTGANSLDIDVGATVPTSFPTDAGTATPAANALTVAGGTNINTAGAAATVTVNLDPDLVTMDTITFNTGGAIRTGTTAADTLLFQAYDNDTGPAYTTFATLTAGNTPTMDLDDAVTKAGGYIYRAGGTDVPVADGGTGVSTLTDHGVLLGSGAAAVTVTAVGTDGQVLIGATGADPAFATITSTGSTIAFTPGANTLNMETGGAVSTSFPTDGGTATPAAGALTIAGGTNITTAGAASTVTVNLDAAISLATSVTSPLYTVASGDLVLNMTDDAGTNSVSFTNNSDAEVAYIDSLGAASFTQLDVDNIRVNGNVISSTDTNGDITLTPDGTGKVNISYLTQYTLPIAGATGEIADLSDGLGAAGEVLTSNGAGAEPTWQEVAGGISWNEETGTSATMAVDNGYIANNAALVTLTLPDTAALGSVVRVAGKGAGGWKIAQNAGETIHFGTSSTTTGATGYLQNTEQYDAVELVCITANTDWVVISSVGNITVA